MVIYTESDDRNSLLSTLPVRPFLTTPLFLYYTALQHHFNLPHYNHHKFKSTLEFITVDQFHNLNHIFAQHVRPAVLHTYIEMK